MYVKCQGTTVVAYPYTPAQLYADNPGVYFPNLSNDTLARFSVSHVVVTGAPEVDYTKNVVEGMPVYNAERSRWEQTWVVSDASVDEIAERTANKVAELRAVRNQKLKDSDWTQVADAPVEQQAWATYRQALRDITAQAGFPWDVVWPQEP